MNFSEDLLENICEFLELREVCLFYTLTKRFYANAAIEQIFQKRVKAYCLSHFLLSIISAYRLDSRFPRTWATFAKRMILLDNLHWQQCDQGKASILRTLKIDRTEYCLDFDAGVIMRTGGHYLFSVWQVAMEEIEPCQMSHDSSGSEEITAKTIVERQREHWRVHMPQWKKLKPLGKGPCPRRYHSMTALPMVSVARNQISSSCSFVSNFTSEFKARRLIIFGGQSEGYPYNSFNSVHMLVSVHVSQNSPSCTKSQWVNPEVIGESPAQRCGHVATLMRKNLVVVTGGSKGTSPIPITHVFLMHIEDNNAFGRIRWSTPIIHNSPPGRSLHSVLKISQNQLLVFGGKQISHSSALFDEYILELQSHCCIWISPDVSGDKPQTRRGHSVSLVGSKLILFGGQISSSGELDNNVYTLDTRNFKWNKNNLLGTAPSCRRGHNARNFGTHITINGGFSFSGGVSPENVKEKMQLPDSDAHIMSFV